jgi:hypothetical protein
MSPSEIKKLRNSGYPPLYHHINGTFKFEPPQNSKPKHTDSKDRPKRDEQTERLLKMTSAELREGGEEYKQLLEQRELKAITGMS